jgi:valyl-tRNA synthetase
VINPDRSKMSKSKGTAITPETLLEQYSADALRYWAARARLGHDTIFDESVFQIGKKLVTKLVNASKFALMQVADNEWAALNEQSVVCAVDQIWLSKLSNTIKEATDNYQQFDYAKALANVEALFWFYCDYYIELVKVRAYQQKQTAEGRSAIAALVISTEMFLKLLAPVLPFVTEEIWSYLPANYNNKGDASIHRAAWPQAFSTMQKEVILFDYIQQILNEVRLAKTQAQKSMKQPVTRCDIAANQIVIDCIKPALTDIADAICAAVENVQLITDEKTKQTITLLLTLDN